jgi:cell division transport system permease protein
MILVRAFLQSTQEQIAQNVDIALYFYPDVGETDVLDVKGRLEQMSDVKEVVYTSRDQALSQFTARHQNDYLTLQALEELGLNPFGAVLGIRAIDIDHYAHIAEVLQNDIGLGIGNSRLIEKITYFENKDIINRISGIIKTLDKGGITISIIFAAISVLLTLIMIRLALHTAREEIHVMRLVGADRAYIQGPFVVEGALAGAFGAAIAFLALIPVSLIATRSLQSFFGSFSLFGYYVHNLFFFAVLLLAVGVLLGMFGSLIGVRAYLKEA